MSILIYTESENGIFKKSAFEIASYAASIATANGDTVTAVCFNASNAQELENYGVQKVLQVTDESLATFSAKKYAAALTEAAKGENANLVILGSGANEKYLAPYLAAKLNAAYIPNVIALPESIAPVKVKRATFTNKAFAVTESNNATTVLGLSKNSFGIHENKVETTVDAFSPSLPEDENKIINTDKATGKVSIADAEIVVSGGRGLKGPENWGLVEELAEVLGGATACSKPVSDMGWRPHSEHVGQTGKPVASNLYIAIGISGAIQHLAGVNASKVKLVINNDAEAPFFKAADYGIVGDAFEVVPKLTEKLKDFKAKNA